MFNEEALNFIAPLENFLILPSSVPVLFKFEVTAFFNILNNNLTSSGNMNFHQHKTSDLSL